MSLDIRSCHPAQLYLTSFSIRLGCPAISLQHFCPDYQHHKMTSPNLLISGLDLPPPVAPRRSRSRSKSKCPVSCRNSRVEVLETQVRSQSSISVVPLSTFLPCVVAAKLDWSFVSGEPGGDWRDERSDWTTCEQGSVDICKVAHFSPVLERENQYSQTRGPGDQDSSVRRDRSVQSSQSIILQDSQGFVHLFHKTFVVLDIFLFFW